MKWNKIKDYDDLLKADLISTKPSFSKNNCMFCQLGSGKSLISFCIIGIKNKKS